MHRNGSQKTVDLNSSEVPSGIDAYSWCRFVHIWIGDIFSPDMDYRRPRTIMRRSLQSVRSRQEGTKEAVAGGAGLRAFSRIAELWHLSVAEQLTLLGISSRSTFYKWRGEPNPKLPRDTLERLSYLIGIYKALQLLLPDTQAADEWVRRPNDVPLFGGRSALERMLSGNVADLYIVRQYLDAQSG